MFDSGSTVHVCSHKEMFNSLVAKEEVTIKMVNGLTCEVISTGTVNVTERDRTVRALEVVWYVLETRYNLISIVCSTKKDAGSKCNKTSSQLATKKG